MGIHIRIVDKLEEGWMVTNGRQTVIDSPFMVQRVMFTTYFLFSEVLICSFGYIAFPPSKIAMLGSSSKLLS